MCICICSCFATSGDGVPSSNDDSETLWLRYHCGVPTDALVYIISLLESMSLCAVKINAGDDVSHVRTSFRCS